MSTDSAARGGAGAADAGSATDPSRAGARSAAAGSIAVAADGGTATACRGPGRYESGKEGSYRPCCVGLNEVLYKAPAYTTGPSGVDIPICDDPPLRVYACVRGTCGDGICEAGESPACGCVADCPNAAWAHPPDQLDDAGAAIAGETLLAGQPKSCGKVDLLAQLQTSLNAIDCGDLAIDASSDAKTAAVKCARDAIAASKPFQLFWLTQGTDSVNHSGVVARIEGGMLHTFTVGLVAANSFGSAYTDENASWFECGTFTGSSSCTGGPEKCLRCIAANDTQCMCVTGAGVSRGPAGGVVSVSCVTMLD